MISVIIPTYNRLNFLKRAVNSVLNQTYRNFEIIVIIDGEDKETYNYISCLSKNSKSNQIKFIENKTKVGANICRNLGFEISEGSYIAFMDDDDEWYPTKLEKQINLLKKNKSNYQLCFTSVKSYNKDGTFKIFPRKNWCEGNKISEYLFKRKFFKSQGLIQTSTIVVSRNVFEKVKFTPNLPKHQDWDWLLNIEYVFGRKIKVFQVEEPLVIYHSDVPNNRISKKNIWAFSFEWAKKNKGKFSGNSYKHFLSSVVLTGLALDRSLKFKEKLKFFVKVAKEKRNVSYADIIYFIGALIKK